MLLWPVWAALAFGLLVAGVVAGAIILVLFWAVVLLLGGLAWLINAASDNGPAWRRGKLEQRRPPAHVRHEDAPRRGP